MNKALPSGKVLRSLIFWPADENEFTHDKLEFRLKRWKASDAENPVETDENILLKAVRSEASRSLETRRINAI